MGAKALPRPSSSKNGGVRLRETVGEGREEEGTGNGKHRSVV